MKKLVSLSLLLFSSLSSFAFAVESDFFLSPEATAAVPATSTVFSIGYIIQLLFSLLVVFGFLYVTAKYFLPKIKTNSKSEHITIVDKLSIEPQVSLYIVKAAKSSWLISVSNKSVALIDKFEGDAF